MCNTLHTRQRPKIPDIQWHRTATDESQSVDIEEEFYFRISRSGEINHINWIQCEFQVYLSLMVMI